MTLYFKLFAVNLKSQMQYKLSFFLTIFGQFITSFSTFFALYFMFSRFNRVDGFTYGQVLLCFSVVMSAFSLGELFGAGFAVFPRLLGNGEFDRALVRPRNTIMLILTPNMDFSRLGLLFQAALVLWYAVRNCGILFSPDKILLLCLMILCGSVVFFCLFLVYASLGFFIVNGLTFANILTYGSREYGRYPFAIYGEGVLKFLTYVIPLALFQYYPLLYLLDINKSAINLIAPLLSLLFAFPAWGLYRLGLKRYTSTGS